MKPHDWIDIYIYFYEYLDDFDISKLLPSIAKDVEQLDEKMMVYKSNLDEDELIERKIHIRLFEEGIDDSLQYYYEDDHGDTIDGVSLDLTLDIIIDFLIRLIYNYPRVEIDDGDGWSYVSPTSIQSLHGNDKINKLLTHRIQFLEQYDIENKILSLRKF
jgi:hypothetical protein